VSRRRQGSPTSLTSTGCAVPDIRPQDRRTC
jgi:hypothetical protein